jgi:hypothetical protein
MGRPVGNGTGIKIPILVVALASRMLALRKTEALKFVRE